jgi:hypothetical protein
MVIQSKKKWMGWPGVPPEVHFPSDDRPLRHDSWPNLSLPTSSGVQVMMTITETVEEGHSACRFSILVGFSVPDLLSFLHYSTVSTSV